MADDVKAQSGLVASSFDILHPGYLRLFKQAKEHCETLVVFLHVDPSVERPEKNKPILSLEERILALESNRYVDKIVPYDTEQDLLEFLRGYSGGDAVRFLGDDYRDSAHYTGKDLDIPIVWIPRDHGWSLTRLRNMIIKADEDAAKDRLLGYMKKLSREHFQKDWVPNLEFCLYNTISADPIFDTSKPVIGLSQKEKSDLIRLHSLAEGWWAEDPTGSLIFLSFGEWSVYYSLKSYNEEINAD